MDRRQFIFGMGGFSLLDLFLSGKELLMAEPSAVTPRGTADALVFINLKGAPSHVDTFDLKVGPWTPGDFDVRTYPGNIKLSYKLFPQLSPLINRFAFVRSVQPYEAEHRRGQYYMQTARALNLGFESEIPHMGSVVSLEFALRSGGKLDLLPPFISFAPDTLGSGFLSSAYEPFFTRPFTNHVAHPKGAERFLKRWGLLERLDKPLRQSGSAHALAFREYYNMYLQAKNLWDSPEFEQAFAIEEEESNRYGGTDFGHACLIASKILTAHRGTHFINIDLDGWDHHVDIYREEGLPWMCYQLDTGLASLIADLENTPHPSKAGQSLLDRTLVVVMGEFGRTVGDLNAAKGRDHYIGAQTALFAGGGIRGGRVLGETDAVGAKIVDPGWKEKRNIRMEDIAVTLYSALGINWAKSIKETPTGRPFEYVPYATAGVHREISELF